ISEQHSTPTADTTIAAVAGKAGSNAITAASAHTAVAAGRGLPGKDIRVHIRAAPRATDATRRARPAGPAGP
uniref:hypothetical protein n=1 Tax=Mycobacterium marinum TaxID=1781 RepID=UPI004028582F